MIFPSCNDYKAGSVGSFPYFLTSREKKKNDEYIEFCESTLPTMTLVFVEDCKNLDKHGRIEQSEVMNIEIE
jgi:hypothetical protein